MTNGTAGSIKETIIDFTVDPISRTTLDKLAKWAQITGILNIILGTLQALTIFVFALPVAVVGIATIVMGTKLTSAASYLRLALYNQDLPSLHLALDQVRSYMTINGILLIIIVGFIILGILMIAFFGAAISDFYDSGFEYSLKSILTFINP